MAAHDTVEAHMANQIRLGLLGLGAVAGIAVHNALFRHGEWHLYAPAIVQSHVLVFILSLIGSIYYAKGDVDTFLQNTALISISYVVALFTSIAVYRLVFHRLTHAAFPGPMCARLTKIWHVWACRNSRNHMVLANLHQRYGDFVRTGPSEITVFDPDVFSAIDGPKSDCIKSEWYDIIHPSISLVTSRSKVAHSTRRRQWNRGFSVKAMAQYEAKIMNYIDQLDSCIEADAVAGRISDVTDLFYRFSFDAMGDFVFNKSFGMLQNEEWHHIIKLLLSALSLLGPCSPVPWVVQLGFKLMPRIGVLKDWFDMVSWCESQMRERIKEPRDETQEPDVAHYLIAHAKSDGFSEESWSWLKGDALLAIVAGSEPVASTAVGIFYELARNPHHAEKIYNEVKDTRVQDAKHLALLPHLNGVIAEALRLYPALPTGGNRKTSERGITIGNRYIPPHTTIVAPRYSISRREDCFERGNEFVPERWYDKPEMVRNKAAYTPFGTGDNSCLGRFLALDDMRLVTAKIVKKYRIRFVPGEDSDCMVRGWRDQFTSKPGRLRLEFELRDEQKN